MKDPETSIVIRTLNEARHLGRLLEAIREQTYTDWEIVLVDSGSTDGTLEVARRYVPESQIHHIQPHEFTFGRSLNFGCRQARGSRLVFTSAHTDPVNNTWLSNLIRPFDDPLVAMVYGRQRGVQVSRLSEVRDLERMFGVTSKVLIDDPFGHNANSAVRRDLWMEQPFDEGLSGLEDVDWARRAQRRGYRVYYAADAALYHIHEESLRRVYRRLLREATAYKRIFPGSRFTRTDAVKGILYNIPADVLFGLRRRMGIGKILQVPGTRVAECLGKYRGFRYHETLNAEVLDGLRTPATSESVVIEEPGRHALQETAVPALADDDVILQIAYVGVCATDVEVAKGGIEYYRNGHARYPIVPGHEFSALVVETGPAARRLRRGDKVVGECAIGCGRCASCERQQYYRCPERREVGVINMNGAYARHLRMPERYVHRVPRSIPLRHAALVEPLAVCLKAIRTLNAEAGATVCVVGAGPLGNFCAQILKARGSRVTVIDQDRRRLALLYKYDINTRTDLGRLEEFDYHIEATGNEDVIPRLVEEAPPGAKILLLGLPYAKPVPVVFSTVPCYEKRIIGSIASEPRDWQEAIRMVQTQAVNLDDHAATVLPLERYEAAWKTIEERREFKVLLSCNATLEGF